jgi:hypothetical protein
MGGMRGLSANPDSMSQPPKIGEYRHRPGNYLSPGPDGAPRLAKVRRRFPYFGIVFLAYGMFGPLVCAGVPLVFRAVGLGAYLPRSFSELPLPPSPTIDNVLFGAGVHELAISCGFAGFWLWRVLWRTRTSDEQQKGGVRAVLPALLGTGMVLGIAFAFAALPIAAVGFFLRSGPADIPFAVKPLFGLFAMPWVVLTAILTGVVPAVLTLLGLLLGAVTSVLVAFAWQQFPEEPDTR